MSDPAKTTGDLKAESNRNRIEFLRTEVETCLTLIGLAEAERSMGFHEVAARSLVHAEAAYSTLVRFLSDPKHTKHITDLERQQLIGSMKQVRDKLDELKG
jgi:hypothetical protein